MFVFSNLTNNIDSNGLCEFNNPDTMIKTIIAILFFCLYSLVTYSQDSISLQTNESDSIKIYQLEKVKQEVKKLKNENKEKTFFRILPTYAGLITAIVAVVGAIISFLKYLKEKENENYQKMQEIKIRKEEKFDSIIKRLCSLEESEKASAAVSLQTFFTEDYKEFHRQAYLILLASLKTDLSHNINALIVKSFETALRLNVLKQESGDPESKDKRFNIELDLSRINLHKIDLQNIKGLAHADFSFSNLQYANLVDCNLVKCNGYKTNLKGARLSRSNLLEGRFIKANFEKAHFHGANLVSAKLKNANLKSAEFQQALLQDAHLDGATIYGARFEHANLNNTYFRNIKYHESDLLSILKAKDRSWEKANFSESTRKKLIRLSEK